MTAPIPSARPGVMPWEPVLTFRPLSDCALVSTDDTELSTDMRPGRFDPLDVVVESGLAGRAWFHWVAACCSLARALSDDMTITQASMVARYLFSSRR